MCLIRSPDGDLSLSLAHASLAPARDSDPCRPAFPEREPRGRPVLVLGDDGRGWFESSVAQCRTDTHHCPPHQPARVPLSPGVPPNPGGSGGGGAASCSPNPCCSQLGHEETVAPSPAPHLHLPAQRPSDFAPPTLSQLTTAPRPLTLSLWSPMRTPSLCRPLPMVYMSPPALDPLPSQASLLPSPPSVAPVISFLSPLLPIFFDHISPESTHGLCSLGDCAQQKKTPPFAPSPCGFLCPSPVLCASSHLPAQCPACPEGRPPAPPGEGSRVDPLTFPGSLPALTARSPSLPSQGSPWPGPYSHPCCLPHA